MKWTSYDNTSVNNDQILLLFSTIVKCGHLVNNCNFRDMFKFRIKAGF